VGPLSTQAYWLFILAIPIASVAWTVTHEEIFREPREYCKRQSQSATSVWRRKFFYLFTCEFCFSHYVSALALLLTRFHLLYADWRGLLIAWLALVWISNVYMAIFANIRLDIHHERLAIEEKGLNLQEKKGESRGHRAA
jgi:hypothetical protein